jgi:hypothetical protein
VKNLIWLADMSTNGFMSGPNGELDWAGANMDDQSWKDAFELLNTVDAALFGRVTYKDFENYWLSAGTNPETPKNERDFLPGLRRAVVAGKGSSTGLHAGEEIAFSIGRFSASGAVAHREAAENPTNNCLQAIAGNRLRIVLLH